MKRIALLVIVGVLLLTLVAGVALAARNVIRCDDSSCNGTDQADKIVEQKGSKADNISAGSGKDLVLANKHGNDNDAVLGGTGNDKIRTDDGDTRDNVVCGGGDSDIAIVDPGDQVSTDCEDIRAATASSTLSDDEFASANQDEIDANTTPLVPEDPTQDLSPAVAAQ